MACTDHAAGGAADANRQRALALSRQLVTRSQAINSTEPLTARRLAAAAWRLARTDEARDNMTTLLTEQRGLLLGHTDRVRGVAFSPDGSERDDDEARLRRRVKTGFVRGLVL